MRAAPAPACWHCAEPTRGTALCPACRKIQPPYETSYFAVFGLSEQLELDSILLDARYGELTRQIHPDRYATASSPEQEYARAHSERVNLAYQTLRDPVARIRYVLGRCETPSDPRKLLPEGLLESYFDLQESLGQLPSAETDERQALLARILAIRETMAGLAAERSQALSELARACDADASRRHEALESVLRALAEYSYVRSMLEETDRKLMESGV